MRKNTRPHFFYYSFFDVDFQTGRIRAAGIVGIERKLEERRKEMDKNISEVCNSKTHDQKFVLIIFSHLYFLIATTVVLE